jgi:beta-lactamase class A
MARLKSYLSFMRVVLVFALAISASAQPPLQQRIAGIALDARGTVSVACSLPGVRLDCGLNEHGHPPMQSVFKFPLALTVLHQIEEGKLRLAQQVRFEKSDRYPGSYSPLQDQFPDADVDVRLDRLLQLSVGMSDNIATDILLRLIGGPPTVQAYLDSLGFSAIHVRDTERAMHDDHGLQYRNSADPTAMVALLRRFADKSPLNPEHTALLNEWITDTPSTPNRIKGQLPPGTVVAHKGGSSDTENGITAATNDVGLITLPNGKRLALAVFVTDAHADNAARETAIARIARAVYDQAIAAK